LFFQSFKNRTVTMSEQIDLSTLDASGLAERLGSLRRFL
jgi:hypothetical protein